MKASYRAEAPTYLLNSFVGYLQWIDFISSTKQGDLFLHVLSLQKKRFLENINCPTLPLLFYQTALNLQKGILSTGINNSILSEIH